VLNAIEVERRPSTKMSIIEEVGMELKKALEDK